MFLIAHIFNPVIATGLKLGHICLAWQSAVLCLTLELHHSGNTIATLSNVGFL